MGYITEDLTEMSHLSAICIDSDMTDSLRNCWEKSLGILLIKGSQQPYQMSKKGHFLAGPGYLGEHYKERNSPKLLVLLVNSDGKSLEWLPGLRGYQEFNLILYEKFHKAVLNGAYMTNHYSCCIYLSNQAKFNENKLVLLQLFLI